MTMYHPFADSICMNLGEPYSLSLLYHKRLSTGNLWSSSQYSSDLAWYVNYEGFSRYYYKYYGFSVVPLADLILTN